MTEAVSADITSQLLRATPAGNDDVVASLLLAVSWLQVSERLVGLPVSIDTYVSDAVRRLPRQHDPRLDAHPGTAWLLLVSLAESIGAFEIARVLLHEIERLLKRRLSEQGAAPLAIEEPQHSTVTLLAIVQARRGRIARQRCDVESAVEWYRDGLRMVRSIPKGDGWATCTLGLATCAQSQGNFPETIRRCRAVLRARPLVAQHSRFGAHLTLAVCLRRLGELDLALQHAWTAFDLSTEQTDQQAQCLINVAEIALQPGQATAARNGFLVLLAQQQPERNRIPAHVGFLEAETLLWERTGDEDGANLRPHIDTMLADAEMCRIPYERIKALVAVLTASVTIGWQEQATRITARLERELNAAAKAGTSFHEFRFRVDSLREKLAAITYTRSSTDSVRQNVPVPPVALHPLSARAKRAVEQLSALSTMESVDVA